MSIFKCTTQCQWPRFSNSLPCSPVHPPDHPQKPALIYMLLHNLVISNSKLAPQSLGTSRKMNFVSDMVCISNPFWTALRFPLIFPVDPLPFLLVASQWLNAFSGSGYEKAEWGIFLCLWNLSAFQNFVISHYTHFWPNFVFTVLCSFPERESFKLHKFQAPQNLHLSLPVHLTS